MCVRERRLSIFAAAICFLFAISAVVRSAPTLTVTSQALNGSGNRVWLAQVTPDAGELPSALAVEIGFTITNAALVDVAGDTNVDAGMSDDDTWYYQTNDGQPYGGLGTNGLWVSDPNNPDLQNLGNNPFTGTVTEGLYTDTVAQQVFAALGSEVFTTDTPVNLLQIVTTGESDATITWTDGLISQNGGVTSGVSGSASVADGLLGDFNGDGNLDCDDINPLTAEIAAGTNDVTFDLTGDDLVNLADRDAWLASAGANNLMSGNPYLLGDANLDGSVDVSDFNEWNGNKFTDIAAWCAGDFNADGSVDVSDFNTWNGNKFQMADAHLASVPEPASGMLFAFGGLLLVGAARASRRSYSSIHLMTNLFHVTKGRGWCMWLAMFVTAVPVTGVSAITIVTGDSSLFPNSADVIAATPTQSTFTDMGTDSLSQTFQVTTAFGMQSIFVAYGNGTAGDLDVGLQIFNVADVASPTLPVNPPPGDILLDTSIMAPTAADGTVMQIILDSPLSLPATTGSAGYAIRFANPDFGWDRTGSSFGDVYPFGQAYENSAEKTSPRDFSLALSTEGPPGVINSVMSGLITDASTWESGAVPVPGNQYVVVNGHAVTADGSAPFEGDLLRIQDGSLTYTANEVTVPAVEVDAGNSVAETLNGNFFLGDVLAPTLGRMTLNGDLTVDLENGGDFGLDVELSGAGNVTVNGTAGTQFFITSIAGFGGNIQFNGGGDEVLYEGPDGSAVTLEMNSTGTNRLALNAASFGGLSEEIIFNQPGEIDHRADGSTGANNRLMSIGSLTANADIAIDLTKTYERSGTPNERRLFAANGWRGAGNITATGTPTDPTTGSATLNELEIGSTSQDGPDATHFETDGYSGILTLNDFLNMEVRHNIPSAEVIVNQNARLEFGHRDVESLFSTKVGEVTVNNAGSLEVGYEADGSHAPYGLRLTKQWGRSGDLTLNNGAKTILQISGTEPNKFDQIVAEGMVVLDGTLELLINPMVPSQTVSCGDAGADCVYTPTDGDTFDLIVIGAETLAADYDGNGIVDSGDYAIWRETFGSDTDLTADGNQDGVVNIADYTVWRNGFGESGSITGSIDTNSNFDSVVVTDPDGVLSGFSVSLNVTSMAVTLTINSVAAIPEPSSLVMMIFGGWAFTMIRRRR